MRVASSREDAWIETLISGCLPLIMDVASSREDAWIETRDHQQAVIDAQSRPPARTRGLKLALVLIIVVTPVASSREDAWIETVPGLVDHF